MVRGSTSPDHFCVWLPAYNGSSMWVMNPLDPKDSVAQYDPGSWQAAFGGAYVIYDLPTPTAPGPPPPEQLSPAKFQMLQDAGMKPSPAHGGPNLTMLHVGDTGNDTGVRVNDASDPPDETLRWARLQWGVMVCGMMGMWKGTVRSSRGSPDRHAPSALLCAAGATYPCPARMAARAAGGRMERQAASWRPAHHPPRWVRMFVTGHDDEGTTATGTPARYGEVAVDPHVIPLGSYVEIAGYGVFRAEDTGGLIVGRRVDIWFPTSAECFASTGWRLARWSSNPADLLDR
jgi:3D (Asp-Asp-Asp) domain-containing protein